jgi:hypothetical protein
VRNLRRFIIPPLLNFIDWNDPIELLTEMRNVVIVFANFVVPYMSPIRLMTHLDNIYKNLCG